MKDFYFPKRIAFITAHPDDETEISAGTIYNNFQKGGKNFLYCATLGEKGNAYVSEDITPEELGLMRKTELFSVGQFLGIEEIVVSDFPDGEVEGHVGRLEKEIQDFISKVKPEVVVSFGADGYSGHKDHIALSKVVQKILADSGVRFLEFAGPSESVCGGYENCLFKKRKNGDYHDLNRKEANICVKIDKEVKLKALNIYKTQWDGLDPYKIFPPSIAEHVLTHEYFFEAND